MEQNATPDQASPTAGPEPVIVANLEAVNVGSHVEDAVQQSGATRTSQANISAAHSLAEIAQRDLDAALQLLADRAQYITGAGGAAIALRRSGKNDMLCRASTGSNAPELGALLSTEFGLSGESVRERRPLRCDDAEHDARVNREVCRQMGIASVAVMPVVHDDEVLGVFELFSGEVNAFGERDLSALGRLSEMVDTAVRLAQAAEGLPELITLEPARGTAAEEVLDVFEPVLTAETVADTQVPQTQDTAIEIPVGQVPTIQVPTIRDSDVQVPAITETVGDEVSDSVGEPVGTSVLQPVLEVETEAARELPADVTTSAVATPVETPQQNDAPAPAQPATAKRPLLWSAPLDAGGEVQKEVQKPAEPDQSHVPPVLRNLRKCEACGFPISAGRVLCVECEEKKWRGQLRVPQAVARQPLSQAPASRPAARAFAAAAQSAAAPSSAVAPQRSSPVDTAVAGAKSAITTDVEVESPNKVAGHSSSRASSQASSPALSQALSQAHPRAMPEIPSKLVLNPPAAEARSAKAEEPSSAPSPEVVFSAGLESSQSWFAAHKYILGAILVIAAGIAAVVLLR
jgi:hypothetical protein